MALFLLLLAMILPPPSSSLAQFRIQSILTQSAAKAVDPREPVTIAFDDDSISVNNLGGKGPDIDKAKEIRVAKAFTYLDKSVDVVITAETPYEGNVEKNAVAGGFVDVNIAPGTDVMLKVSFEDHHSRRAVVVHQFEFAVMDTDAGKGNTSGTLAGFEAIMAGPLVGYTVPDSTQLRISNAPMSDEYFVFNASDDDRPVAGESLDAEQGDKAVVLQFASTSKFRLQFSVSPASVGRTFKIGGSGVFGTAKITKTTVGPCHEHRRLDFSKSTIVSTDLAGKGMRFANVFPFSGPSVDLVVTADSSHGAWDPDVNGLSGFCGLISLAVTNATELTFTFKKSGTDTTVKVERFFFSLLGIGSTSTGIKEAAIIKREWSNVWRSYNSALTETLDGDLISYKGTAFGNEKTNPTDPLLLRTEDMPDSITFFRKEPIQEFRIKLTATEGTMSGRNLFFAGRTNYVCPHLS